MKEIVFLYVSNTNIYVYNELFIFVMKPPCLEWKSSYLQ